MFFEAFGFLSILAACWLDEWTGFHDWPMKPAGDINWNALTVETLIILAVGISVMLITRKLLERILYLEGFVRLCAWCRKVRHGGAWIHLEEFLHRGLEFGTTHGICPGCREQAVSAHAAKEPPAPVA